MQLAMKAAALFGGLPALASAAGLCSKSGEQMPAPRQAGALLRLQANRSLSLPGRFMRPVVASLDEAFDVGTWEEFATKVGTQDFSFDFLRDSSGHEYVHFSYGLGDNEFGSVHPREASAEPIISVDDGEWSGLGLTPTSLVSCLQEAVEDDEEQADASPAVVQAVSAACSKADEQMPSPRQAGALLRLQANRSLSLPGRFMRPAATLDEAFETGTWEEFARMVGTQDFSFDFLQDTSGHQYVHFSYGLGDNEFGSVHPRETSAEPIISIDDGEWNGLGLTPTSLVSCLQEAVDGSEDAANVQAVAQPTSVLV